MRQIRYNMFETNSSSVHALVMSKKKIKDYSELPKLYIHHGNYGWNNDTYHTPDDIISYLCQAIWDMNYEWYSSDDNNNTAKARVAIQKFLEPLYEMGIEYEFENDYWKYSQWSKGYVDHADSLSELIETFTKKPDKLVRFVFGEQSMIVTGNDNDELPGTWSRLQYLNNKDTEVYYKYN